jgi:flagellar basal-body rod protein FlgC
MSAFGSIDLSATGLNASRLWIEVISHNMANLDTIRPSDEEPFRALLLEVAENRNSLARGGGGVVAVGLHRSERTAQRVQDPDHPFADENGTVVRPVVDMATEMSNLIIATRLYQVNLRTIESSREAYASALRIGAS